MIIECPKCKSTFSISNEMEINNFSNFKCSVCMHTWKINKNNDKAKLDEEKKSINGYFYVVILNLVILVLVVIALIYFKDKLLYTNGYWTTFYNFFLNLIPIK
jgi:predicted Zn finger-like uncharacterized protein